MRLITGGALVGDRALIAETPGFFQPGARVQAYRFDVALGEYVSDGTIQWPQWIPGVELMDLASDGSTAVTLPRS